MNLMHHRYLSPIPLKSMVLLLFFPFPFFLYVIVNHEILQRMRAVFASGGSPLIICFFLFYFVTNRYAVLFLDGWLYVVEPSRRNEEEA